MIEHKTKKMFASCQNLKKDRGFESTERHVSNKKIRLITKDAISNFNKCFIYTKIFILYKLWIQFDGIADYKLRQIGLNSTC